MLSVSILTPSQILLNSGKVANLLDFEESDVDLGDIAHALSMICRYNGHVNKFYSVAEHSVLIAREILFKENDPKAALCGLLHDAPEAYIGDIVRPLRNIIKSTILDIIESDITAIICFKFGLFDVSSEQDALVRAYDAAILNDEMAALFTYVPTSKDCLGVKIKNWTPLVAEAKFIHLYHELILSTGHAS